jgi:hypothetical protein
MQNILAHTYSGLKDLAYSDIDLNNATITTKGVTHEKHSFNLVLHITTEDGKEIEITLTQES